MTKSETYKQYEEYFLLNDNKLFTCSNTGSRFHCYVCPWNYTVGSTCTSIAYNDYMKHTKSKKLLELLK